MSGAQARDWRTSGEVDASEALSVRIEEFGGDDNLLGERRPGESNVDIESDKILDKASTW